MPRFTPTFITRVLIAAGVITGLTLGGLTPAQADTPQPSHKALIAKYGRGSLVADKDATYVAPNITGLKNRRYTTLGAASAATPAAYSLQQYAMPVGDQGTLGSCTTWALGYNMLGWYSRYMTGQVRAYAPMYIYSQDMVGNDQGSTVDDGYDILGQQGIPLQSEYAQGNYDNRTQPTAAQRAAAAANKITAPHWLYDMAVTNQVPGAAARTAIEAAISQKHPVALSIPLFDPFYNLNATNAVLYASQITGSNAVDYGGHEVLIVGYNDTGVIIQNQWGTDWGNGGYATLDWAFVQQYSVDATWIYGFQRDFNLSQTPAGVQAVEITTTANYGATANVKIRWRGTAVYDDAAVHPVTGYNLTVTGTDGYSRTVPAPALAPRTSQWVSLSGLNTTATYTASINATNAVGDGPVTTYTFNPASVAYGPTFAPDTASPAMPAAAVQQSTTTVPTETITPPPTTTNPTVAPVAPKPVTRKPAVKPASVKAKVTITKRKHKVVKATARWTAPKSTGNSPIKNYRVKIVGAKKGHTKYTHTFTYGAKVRQGVYRFTGKYKLRHGLAYKVIVTVKNSAGKWSTTRTTFIGRL